MLPINTIQNNLLCPKLAFGERKPPKKAGQAQKPGHNSPKAVQAHVSFKTLSTHANGLYEGIYNRAEALIEKYPHARHCIKDEIIAAINRGSKRERELKRIQQLDKEKREKAEKKLGQKCAKNDAFMAITDLENRLNPKTQIIENVKQRKEDVKQNPQNDSTTATATRQPNTEKNTQQPLGQPPSYKKDKAEKRRQALIQTAIRATGLSKEALNRMENDAIQNEIKGASKKRKEKLMQTLSTPQGASGTRPTQHGYNESEIVPVSRIGDTAICITTRAATEVISTFRKETDELIARFLNKIRTVNPNREIPKAVQKVLDTYSDECKKIEKIEKAKKKIDRTTIIKMAGIVERATDRLLNEFKQLEGLNNINGNN